MRDLRVLVLKLARQAGAPANAAVGAGHIRNQRAGRGRAKAIGLRDHVGDLIAAPTVSLNADRLLVNKALVDYRLNCRQHTLQRALSRIADRVNDVRHEDQVAVAGIESGIDRSARSRDCGSCAGPATAARRCRRSSDTFSSGSKFSGFIRMPFSGTPSTFLKLTNSAVPQLNRARCASPLLTFFRF